MQDVTLTVTPADEIDAGQAASLLASSAAAHGILAKGLDWFDWKFRRSPWGPATVAYASNALDEVVGAVAIGEYRLASGSTTLRAGISYETFVHPEYQGRGIFGRLLALAENAVDTKYDLLLNFPNSASRRGFLSAGWTDTGRVGTWVHIRRPIAASRGLLRAKLNGEPLIPHHSTVRGAQLADSVEWEQLGSAVACLESPSNPHRVHDPEFLEWRFAPLSGAHAIITLGKLSILYRSGLRAGARETQILEVFCEDPSALQQLRRATVTLGQVTDADFLSLLASPGHPIASRLTGLGFLPVPNRVSMFVKQPGTQAGFGPSSDSMSIVGSDIHTW